MRIRKLVTVHTPFSRNALASGFFELAKKPDANAFRQIPLKIGLFCADA